MNYATFLILSSKLMVESTFVNPFCVCVCCKHEVDDEKLHFSEMKLYCNTRFKTIHEIIIDCCSSWCGLAFCGRSTVIFVRIPYCKLK